MASLISKVGAIAPLEPGERVLCAAYVTGTRSSIGAALDRRVGSPAPPRPAVRLPLTRSLAREAPRRDPRRVAHPASLGFAAAHQFEIIGVDGSGMAFELENRKDAKAFNDALARRLVTRG